MTDAVNHPAHYTAHPSGVEVIEITEHMGFCLGNVVKYVLRCDRKGKPLEDLRKAAWYLEREIARREAAELSSRIDNLEPAPLVIDSVTDALLPIKRAIARRAGAEVYCAPAQDWHPVDIECVHCLDFATQADAIMDGEQFVRGDE